jgi:hypothetical protein
VHIFQRLVTLVNKRQRFQHDNEYDDEYDDEYEDEYEDEYDDDDDDIIY